MAQRVWTEQELMRMGLLDLEEPCRALGVTFDPARERLVLVDQILLAQQGRRETTTPATTSTPATSPSSPRDESVLVMCGAGSMPVPAVGKTVGHVRRALADQLNIGSNFQARLNGRDVADDYVLQDGERLEFGAPSGTKA